MCGVALLMSIADIHVFCAPLFSSDIFSGRYALTMNRSLLSAVTPTATCTKGTDGSPCVTLSTCPFAMLTHACAAHTRSLS